MTVTVTVALSRPLKAVPRAQSFPFFARTGSLFLWGHLFAVSDVKRAKSAPINQNTETISHNQLGAIYLQYVWPFVKCMETENFQTEHAQNVKHIFRHQNIITRWLTIWNGSKSVDMICMFFFSNRTSWSFNLPEWSFITIQSEFHLKSCLFFLISVHFIWS